MERSGHIFVHGVGRTTVPFAFVFFAHPFYHHCTVLSPAPSLDITQIRGHKKQALLPPLHYVTRLHFYREETPAISSLVDSHRTATTRYL